MGLDIEHDIEQEFNSYSGTTWIRQTDNKYGAHKLLTYSGVGTLDLTFEADGHHQHVGIRLTNEQLIALRDHISNTLYLSRVEDIDGNLIEGDNNG